MGERARSTFLRIARALVLLVYVVVMAYVVILSMAFFLRLFGANPTASFTDWVYTAAARIMEPFRGIFPTRAINGNSVFDASLLFAVVVYSLFAMLLQAGVIWLSGHIYVKEHPQGEAAPAATWAPAGAPGAYPNAYSAPPGAPNYRYPAPPDYSYPAQRSDAPTEQPRMSD